MRNILINLLRQINIANHTASNITIENISRLFNEHCQGIFQKLNCSYGEINSDLEDVTKFYSSDSTIPEWRYIILNIFILRKLGDLLKSSGEETLLSVKEVAIVKSTISMLTNIGVSSKLISQLQSSSAKFRGTTDDIFYEYNILKCTILALCNFLNRNQFRILIISCSLSPCLVGLYQIAYCPLRTDFTDKIMCNLLIEKQMAIDLLGKLENSIHSTIYIKDTMMIFNEKSPRWFKDAISKTLTHIMLSRNGLDHIIIAMSNVVSDEIINKALNPIVQLMVFFCGKYPEFKNEIQKRLVNLVDTTNDEYHSVFERLFIKCTKQFYYSTDPQINCDLLVKRVLKGLQEFTYTSDIDKRFTTNQLKQSVRLMHGIFVENDFDYPLMPINLLKPILNVLFRIYCITTATIFQTTNNECKDILCTFIRENQQDDIILFDSFIFNFPHREIPLLQTNLILTINDSDILLNVSEHSIIFSVFRSIDCLMKLLKGNDHFLKRLFLYLLRCLNNTEKYFVKANDSLLTVEDKVMSEYFTRRLAIYNILSSLANIKSVQQLIINSPREIIQFINNTLENTITNKIHITNEYETDEFRAFFTVILILNSLLESRQRVEEFQELIKTLKLIKNETKHIESSQLISNILMHICDTNIGGCNSVQISNKTKFDVIVQDICDPLLPVKAHGLLTLKKLVEEKDSCVMERKQFILTIFQQHLKDKDSFVYLNAINGLVSLADVFTDTVLTIICDEYSEFTRDDDKEKNEIRMKVGEVLVKATKLLGEMAPKYKALLLNTFLNGIKDNDYLIRCSSLSNLGEVCRILGYKIGTTISEILLCVHAIITTDKAIEARRAAVTVIKQLLIGLESEMIAYLKDDILPIYRTLKHIYLNDGDDVMRLQAQLALEELNENMRNFVFPEPQLIIDGMRKNLLI